MIKTSPMYNKEIIDNNDTYLKPDMSLIEFSGNKNKIAIGPLTSSLNSGVAAYTGSTPNYTASNYISEAMMI